MTEALPALPTHADLGRLDGPEPLTPEEVDDLIAEALAAGETEPGAVVPARWVPADEGAANWAHAHLERLSDEIATIARHHRELVDRANDWLKLRTKLPVARAAFFDAALREYGLRWQAEDPKRRTLHLPDGGAVAVTVPKAPTITIASEPEVMAWARSETNEDGPGPQDCIHHTPDTLYVSEVRKWVKAVRTEEGEWVAVSVRSGAVVPGLTVEPPKDPHARVVL